MDDTQISLTANPINNTSPSNNTGPSKNTAPDSNTDTVAPASEDVKTPHESTAENSVVSTAVDVRLQRILDYLDESLAKGSPFEASLGAVNTDLLLMAYRLGQVFEDTIQQGPAGVDELEELVPTMEQYLKVSKQIDRFSQIAIKLDNIHATSKTSKLAAIQTRLSTAPSEDSAS